MCDPYYIKTLKGEGLEKGLRCIGMLLLLGPVYGVTLNPASQHATLFSAQFVLAMGTASPVELSFGCWVLPYLGFSYELGYYPHLVTVRP